MRGKLPAGSRDVNTEASKPQAASRTPVASTTKTVANIIQRRGILYQTFKKPFHSFNSALTVSPHKNHTDTDSVAVN